MFDIDVAGQVGIVAAILFHNIGYWCMHSQANGTNFHDGRFWTYNTNKALCELFPYMSGNTIRYAIKKLIDADLIVTGNYNRQTYDRTMWYALTENGKCIFQKGQMEVTKLANGFEKISKPIPDINTDINTDSKPNIESRGRFVPPTLDEVKAYIKEKGYIVDPDLFINHYESKGWMVGKTKMTSWKASLAGWNAREVREHPEKKPREYKDMDVENIDEWW